VFLIVLILIFTVLIVLSVYTVLNTFCTRTPARAYEPRSSIISLHVICLLFDLSSTHAYLIINSIQNCSIVAYLLTIWYKVHNALCACELYIRPSLILSQTPDLRKHRCGHGLKTCIILA